MTALQLFRQVVMPNQDTGWGLWCYYRLVRLPMLYAYMHLPQIVIAPGITIGGFEGRAFYDICATFQGSSDHWRANPEECFNILSQRVHGFETFLLLAIYVLLLWQFFTRALPAATRALLKTLFAVAQKQLAVDEHPPPPPPPMPPPPTSPQIEPPSSPFAPPHSQAITATPSPPPLAPLSPPTPPFASPMSGEFSPSG